MGGPDRKPYHREQGQRPLLQVPGTAGSPNPPETETRGDNSAAAAHRTAAGARSRAKGHPPQVLGTVEHQGLLNPATSGDTSTATAHRTAAGACSRAKGHPLQVLGTAGSQGLPNPATSGDTSTAAAHRTAAGARSRAKGHSCKCKAPQGPRACQTLQPAEASRQPPRIAWQLEPLLA